MPLFAPYDVQECSYRRHFFTRDARIFQLFAGFIVLVFPVILLADYKLWQTTPVFFELMTLRLGVVALALTAIIRVRCQARPEVVDFWAFALAMSIALSNNFVILSRPPTYLHHINLELIAIVLMYATLPDRHWIRLSPPMAMSAGSLILIFTVKAPVGLVGGISIVLAYLVVNALGAIISSSFYTNRRLSFRAGLELDAANRQLAQSEQRYRQLIDNTHGIIYTIDPAGLLTYVSPSWTRLLGHAASEVVGQSLSRFIHADDLAAWDTFLEQTVRSGEVTSGQAYRVFHADGSLRWHRSNILPCFDEAGVLHSFVGTAIDITEIKQYESELLQAQAASEHANQAKSEFLALIGHEIRTPMQAIIGFSTLIAKVDDPVKIHQYCTTLEQAARSLLSLIDDILDVSRIEQGRLLLEPAPVALHEVIGEIDQLFRMLAARKNIAFCLDLADNVPAWVEADPVRLRQILSNLISNAVKFTECGEVACSFMLPLPQPINDFCMLCCTVSDSGIGIAPERQAEIFEPFRQQDPSITRKFGGSGLGLSIVHRLTEMMGGTVDLVSKPGVGSTFTVRLPLRVAVPPGTPPVKTVASKLVDLQVLVVEDSEANRAFLLEALNNQGYRVKTAKDGFEAISLYAQCAYDVVLMDLRLPGMNGIETTRRIREQEQEDRRQRVPIIALSADIDQSTRASGLAAGIDTFLAKPAPVERITAAIAALIPTLTTAAPVADSVGGIDLLSPQTLRDLEYSSDRCQGFLDILLADIGRACQRLERAIAANDRRTMAEQAHTLKGLCGHLSDAAIRDLAMWLHTRCSDTATEELQGAMRLLDDAYRRVMIMAERNHG